MNKDVIYIEPEDDITDIITKVKNANERIVALVPPRKAEVFRSVVNIKLIAKSGAAEDKTVVLVTTDPSIIKMAAAVKMPVTKNLQSAPAIPTAEALEKIAAQPEIIEVLDDIETAPSDTVADSAPESRKKARATETKSVKNTLNQPEASAEKVAEIPEKTTASPDDFLDNNKRESAPKKAKKDKSPQSGGWVRQHKKLLITGIIAAVVLVGVLIWALIFAPAVTVDVAVQTESKNFSENVSFVTKLEEENAAEGKFYIEQKKSETTNEVTFTATGQKNNGEKAHGVVIVLAYFEKSGAVAVNAGSFFSVSGLSFVSNNDVTLSWDGDERSCENIGTGTIPISGCRISAKASVTAVEAGAKYNIAATSSGWSTTANVGVYSDTAMTGGTDDIITIVQQSDIESAKTKLTTASEDEDKEKLLKTIGDDYVVINSSFKQTESAATATPAAGEAMDSGATPKLKVTTTSTVYIIDKTKLIQFITEKVDLTDDQKVYEVSDPRVESFATSGSGYVGKIKTTYLKGPSLVESDIMEKIRGKGLGDAQYELRRIEGVSEVTVTPSYPWVTHVPSDSSRIDLHANVETSNNSQDSQSQDAGKTE